MRRAPSGTPLYLHLPFCAAKCHYCDFYSVAEPRPDFDGLVDGLLREARGRAPAEPRTVFFGGGTPSHFPVEALERLFDGLDETTGFRRSASEVTVECNPESLTPDVAAALVALGADRLSIGLQSLRPEALELFGRPHGVEQGLLAFEAARAAAAPTVSVDLIYAVPGQGALAWEQDLRAVLALGPDHFSAYNLAFEEATPFARWLASGRLERVPEALELELFWSTRRVAEELGFQAYEVSNFALNESLCQHNVNYWENGPYVGLGPSAVSKVGRTRFGNPRSIQRWQGALQSGRDARDWEETPSPRRSLGETWWLGLRLAAGVDPRRALLVAGFSPDELDDQAPDPAAEIAGELVAQGLLERAGKRFRLSRSGLPLADAVATRFLENPPEGSLAVAGE